MGTDRAQANMPRPLAVVKHLLPFKQEIEFKVGEGGLGGEGASHETPLQISPRLSRAGGPNRFL
jgi:hypothetical protein